SKGAWSSDVSFSDLVAITSMSAPSHARLRPFSSPDVAQSHDAGSATTTTTPNGTSNGEALSDPGDNSESERHNTAAPRSAHHSPSPVRSSPPAIDRYSIFT